MRAQIHIASFERDGTFVKKNLVFVFCLMQSVLCLTACGGRGNSTQSEDPRLGYDDIRKNLIPKVTKKNAKNNLLDSALPESLQKSSDRPAYATDVFLYAGCESNPSTVFVVNGQLDDDPCANLIAIAAYYDDDTFYKVAAQFNWQAEETGVVTIDFPYGPHGNLCRVHGSRDIFDNQEDTEPLTKIIVCTANTCSKQKPADCQDQACAEMVYVSIVNLEGNWRMNGTTFEPDAEMILLQNGRRFKDQKNGIKDGSIQGTVISFEIDDYLYLGELSDRDHMQGEVMELMCNQTMGSWQAERVYP